LLVEAGVLVAPLVLEQVVDVDLGGNVADVPDVGLHHDAAPRGGLPHASTTPSRLATQVTPESRATTASIPVPTSGDWVRSSGTAWRCMLLPMSARLASSFSRNGMREA